MEKQNSTLEYIGVDIFGPLFPLTSIVPGIGFLITRQLPSWISIMLTLAGIGFPPAQAVGTKYFHQLKIAGI
jgi:hypothetical protein